MAANPERAAAKAAGLTTYWGSPCAKGHPGLRYVRSKHCVPCEQERCRERRRVARRVDPQAERNRETARKMQVNFGLTMSAYQTLFDTQGGVCAICARALVSRADSTRELRIAGRGVPRNVACVDHDHSTGAVRGLLCVDCNVGLGNFRDDSRVLLKAAGYLRASATLQAQPVAARESASEIEPAMGPRFERCRGSRRDELNQFD